MSKHAKRISVLATLAVALLACDSSPTAPPRDGGVYPDGFPVGIGPKGPAGGDSWSRATLSPRAPDPAAATGNAGGMEAPVVAFENPGRVAGE